MNHIPLKKIPSNPYTNNQGLGFYLPISFKSRVRRNSPNQTLEKEPFYKNQTNNSYLFGSISFPGQTPNLALLLLSEDPHECHQKKLHVRETPLGPTKILICCTWHTAGIALKSTTPNLICLSCYSSLLEYTTISSRGKPISHYGGNLEDLQKTHPESPSLLVHPLISLRYYECQLYELDTLYNLFEVNI